MFEDVSQGWIFFLGEKGWGAQRQTGDQIKDKEETCLSIKNVVFYRVSPWEGICVTCSSGKEPKRRKPKV